MPIYEYLCTQCATRFEKKQGYDEEPLTNCPVCNGRVERVFFPPTWIPKCSGFYRTDKVLSDKPKEE